MTDNSFPDIDRKDDPSLLDTTYDGLKSGQQSFYDQLWELLETELGDTVLCDQMADRIYDLIKSQCSSLLKPVFYGGVAELVDAPDLKSVD